MKKEPHMKARESGMPDEADWQSFFDAEAVTDRLLGKEGVAGNLVELGCGYGTFTIPAALRTLGVVTALDIDPEMVASVQQKAAILQLPNIRAEVRDFVAQGIGVEAGTQAHVMVFNLLHLEQPIELLQEVHRVLHAGGQVSIIHWRSDIPTPRGPSLAIRPRPEQCLSWLEKAGFLDAAFIDIRAFCPYHFGLVAHR
jgi:SAM-dependent methyltransferase